MYLLDLREQVMDMLERLTGARVTCAVYHPGGVRCDIHPEDRVFIHESLDRIEKELTRYAGMFENGPMIALRSRGIGILTPEAARQAHAVGPTARASGIAIDRRTEHPTYRKPYNSSSGRSGVACAGPRQSRSPVRSAPPRAPAVPLPA